MEFLDFLSRLDQWVASESPSQEWRFAALAWMSEFQDDPRRFAVPSPGLGGAVWMAIVAEDDHHGLVCVYTIVGSTVRCSQFSTLRKPIM